MCSYHGGKQRIGKRLSSIIADESLDIEDEYDFKIKGYCEPFCGMLGVYKHIPDLFDDHKPKLKYKAGDINKSVIKMWQKAQKGWKPPITSSESEYDRLKNSKDSAIRGYIGHQYSFGGQFFNGYAPKYNKTTDSTKASQSVIDISKTLNDVQFSFGSYTQYSKLKSYIIYCDPPYDNTVSRYYKNASPKGREAFSDRKLTFESEKFWIWCRKMSKDNIVFVSSYTAPKDFEEIFSSSHKLTGISANNNDKKRIEKLFLIF